MLDNPEIRYSVVEQLVNRYLLQHAAASETFRVPDGQLQQFIAKLPAFQENGQFSPERYRQLLAGQNMTPVIFEDRLRQDLLLAPVTEPIALGNITARTSGVRVSTQRNADVMRCWSSSLEPWNQPSLVRLTSTSSSSPCSRSANTCRRTRCGSVSS